MRGVAIGLLAVLWAALLAGLLTWPWDLGRNGVHWIEGRPGLYFDGRGIAHTARPLARADGAPLDALTVALVTRERPTTGLRNSGVILTPYQGMWPSPPPVIGMRRGRVFVFDVTDGSGPRWMEAFLAEPVLAPGEDHFVAVTVDREERAIWVASDFVAHRQRGKPARPDWLAGRLVVGTAPSNYASWVGELRGLAIYSEVLRAEELARAERSVAQQGIRGLAPDGRLIALYAFDEGGGDVARNGVPGGPVLHIPTWSVGLPETLFDPPAWTRFLSPSFVRNIAWNVALFAPLGFLLGLAVAPAPLPRRQRLVLGAILAGGLLSLGLEALQLALPARQTGLFDVVNNTLGTALGVAVALRVCRR